MGEEEEVLFFTFAFVARKLGFRKI